MIERPFPRKVDLKEIQNFLKTVAVVEDQIDSDLLSTKESQSELVDYLDIHAKRLWCSLKIISDWNFDDLDNALELGAMPYYFSALLRQYYPTCKLSGVNIKGTVWPEIHSNSVPKKQVKIRYGNHDAVDNLDIYVLNLERDFLPFPDSFFDSVLCMEVIEHLIYSPTHMLAEAHRVLKPGGRILISTPNAIDLRKTISLILNRPIAFKYSGYGIYGRHNREFTKDELIALVEKCGYKILDVKLKNILGHSYHTNVKQVLFRILNLITNIPIPYFLNKREYIFMVAESTGKPCFAYPENLYHFRDLYKPQS